MRGYDPSHNSWPPNEPTLGPGLEPYRSAETDPDLPFKVLVVGLVVWYAALAILFLVGFAGAVRLIWMMNP